MFRPKVSIFVWVWVVSVLFFQAPHVQGHFEIWKQVVVEVNGDREERPWEQGWYVERVRVVSLQVLPNYTFKKSRV